MLTDCIYGRVSLTLDSCRVFQYKSGKLSSAAAPAEPGVPPGSLDMSDVVVERVVFLGLPSKGSYKAKLPDGKVSGASCNMKFCLT